MPFFAKKSYSPFGIFFENKISFKYLNKQKHKNKQKIKVFKKKIQMFVVLFSQKFIVLCGKISCMYLFIYLFFIFVHLFLRLRTICVFHSNGECAQSKSIRHFDQFVSVVMVRTIDENSNENFTLPCFTLVQFHLYMFPSNFRMCFNRSDTHIEN